MLDGLWMVLAGLAAGFISGLMGVGGGIVLTPFLHYVLGRTWSDAVATSLFVIALQAPLGVYRHAQRGAVHWRIAAWLAGGGLLGVAIGDWALPHLPVAGLKLLFATLMGLAAYRFAIQRPPAPGATPTPPPVHPWHLLLALGVGAGIISRLLGVGGGILTVPALGLLGIPVHVAVASSLVPVFSNAAVASGANLARSLDASPAILLAAGALIGTTLGVRAAHALPEAGLRRVVAGALALVAVLVAATAL